jgi:hypothetical protein
VAIIPSGILLSKKTAVSDEDKSFSWDPELRRNPLRSERQGLQDNQR